MLKKVNALTSTIEIKGYDRILKVVPGHFQISTWFRGNLILEARNGQKKLFFQKNR